MLQPPPTSKAFDNKDAVFKFVQSWAIAHGYAVSKTSSSETRLQLKCIRGGKHKSKFDTSEEQRQRDRKSQLTQCPWKVNARLHAKDKKWHIRVTHPSHNHPACPSATISRARFLTDEEKQTADQMLKNGDAPRVVLAALKQSNPNLTFTSRDLYNYISKLRSKNELPKRK